ncbi:hypothetical protein JHK85_001148 [Glycine max]|nr:hypothetical protein JHK85_001148 [Glycine max]KAG5088504.1 hypothetical protein JHK86_001116 [Glycine max]
MSFFLNRLLVHSMIFDQSYKSILKYCNFIVEETSKKCDHVYSYAVNYEFGNIDQYNIYTRMCTTSQNNTVRHMRFKNLHMISGYDPCTENYAEKYYNLPEVQIAMHANVTNIPYKWNACRFGFSLAILLRKDEQKHCALIYNLQSKSRSSKFYEMTSFNTWLDTRSMESTNHHHDQHS